MNDTLRRAAVVRKITYLGLILALFTLSMFWRGKLSLPGNAIAAAEADYARRPAKTIDRLASLPIAAQAERLELRELDLGDAEVAGSVARVTTVGFQGIVTTAMWWKAIEAQKRGEYHEFELLARSVTRLQPHFIDPWIFQAWNITYNVSVENDKLGDMYFYIARGIELLAEGDRLNTRRFRGRGVDVMIGSPDIRYQLAFYYQNKFSVSDKVSTLRCLSQLSAMKPSERDPSTFLDERDQVRPERFRKFCEDNPQLVRRLAEKLDCRTPRDVVDFLKANKTVPTRYRNDGGPNRDDLLADDAQFPILPKDAAAGQEYKPRDPTDDRFDVMHAARAWFESAQLMIPPAVKGVAMRSPRPTTGDREPGPGEYDPYRYRMPARPQLVIFRGQPARAQTNLADRLQSERWFDAETRWNPATTGFPELLGGPGELKAGRNSQEEFETTHRMWEDFGQMNGLLPTKDKLRKMEEASRACLVLGAGVQGSLSDEDLARFQISRETFNLSREHAAYTGNRSVTNFDRFILQADAERTPKLVEARKLLDGAARDKERGEFIQASKNYARAIASWREALSSFREYREYRDYVSEQTAEFELTLASLLKDDDSVRLPMKSAPDAVYAVVSVLAKQGVQPEPIEFDLRALLAENESVTRIAMATRNNPELEAEVVKKGGDPEKARRELIDGPFAWMKRMTGPKLGEPAWVPAEALDRAKQQMGLKRKVAAPTAPQPDAPQPGGR